MPKLHPVDRLRKGDVILYGKSERKVRGVTRKEDGRLRDLYMAKLRPSQFKSPYVFPTRTTAIQYFKRKLYSGADLRVTEAESMLQDLIEKKVSYYEELRAYHRGESPRPKDPETTITGREVSAAGIR